MSEVHTYGEMNRRIVGILRNAELPHDSYAAQRIEELEAHASDLQKENQTLKMEAVVREAIVAKLPDRLATYEMDEPHWNEDQDREHYPETNWRDWLEHEHQGDCTHYACVCLRCEAEHILHKSEWLLGETANTEGGDDE